MEWKVTYVLLTVMVHRQKEAVLNTRGIKSHTGYESCMLTAQTMKI